MKKCPYCGQQNEDDATGCKRCKAGFPQGKDKSEEPVRVFKRKNNKESE